MGRIQHKIARKLIWDSQAELYEKFDQLDGSHDWQNCVPEACVLYPVRKLKKGKIAYFNYDLAKEMGLIAKVHPHGMTDELEKKIIDTFSIQIINEYDQNKKSNKLKSLKTVNPKLYMATRYLQLQHKSKSGKTSGDGRSIWNGQINYQNTIWDVSSRGTGVTKLAPGAVEAGKPLKSGATTHGYGCGTADLDELLSSAIHAEIMHKNGITTERVLTVIDMGDGNGIGVRAAKNLFRPAHFMIFLKQNKYESLKNSIDYFINRQFQNKEWQIHSSNPKKYDLFLEQVVSSFAKFSAQLEREYIFAWVDWDGDNILANAGIIDYGSIRQFGLMHDQYRYDDVDRFSTTLREQTGKIRYLIQTYIQIINYIETKNKKPISAFKTHWAIKGFNEKRELYLFEMFLRQTGYSESNIKYLLKNYYSDVKKLYTSYVLLERTKSRKSIKKVSDGVNRPAIFNMRLSLSEIPLMITLPKDNSELQTPTKEQFFKKILAKNISLIDKSISRSQKINIDNYLSLYLKITKILLLQRKIVQDLNWSRFLKTVSSRSANLNHKNRMTGDGLLLIVDELINHKNKIRSPQFAQNIIDQIILHQTSNNPNDVTTEPRLHNLNSIEKTLLVTALTLIDDCKESI
jgi:hypothetical protein